MAEIKKPIRTTLSDGSVILSNILDSTTGESVEYKKILNSSGIIIDGDIYRQLDTPEFGTEVFKKIITKPLLNEVAIKTTIEGIRSFAGELKSTTVYTTDIKGTWNLDLNDTVSLDNTGTVLVDSIGRRWKREYTGNIEGKWFDLREDRAALENDERFIKALIVAQSENKPLSLPSGKIPLYNTIALENVIIDSTNTELVNANNDTPILNIKDNVILKGIEIDGSIQVGDVGSLKPNIVFQSGGFNRRLENCVFKNGRKYNIQISNASYFWIVNCDFFNNINDIEIFDGGDHIYIDRNRIKDSYTHEGAGEQSNAIKIVAPSGTFSSNIYEYVYIRHNEINNITRMGIEAFKLQNSEISYNVINEIGSMGISLPTLGNSIVKWNKIHNVGTYGIELPGTVGNNVIFENEISRSLDYVSTGTNEAIILSSFNNSTTAGFTHNRFNKIIRNRILNWDNGTRDNTTNRVIRILNGDDSLTTLNCSDTEVSNNFFYNSGKIQAESFNSKRLNIYNNKFVIDRIGSPYGSVIEARGDQCTVNSNNIFIESGITNISSNSAILCRNGVNQQVSKNRIIDLSNCFNYGISDSTATNAGCVNIRVHNNLCIGYKNGPIRFENTISNVSYESDNGTTNLAASINVTIKSERLSVLEWVYGTFSYSLNESILPSATSGSFHTSRGGNTFIKRSGIDNTGWTPITSLIVDDVLAGSINNGTLNTKYPVTAYRGCFIKITSLNRIYSRVTDTTWDYLEIPKIQASTDVAANVGTVYSQTEVQAILNELRDLKTKMRTAGILLT